MSSIYSLSTVLVVSGAPVVLGNSGLSGLLHSVNNAVQEHLPIQHSSMFGIEESYAGSSAGRGMLQSDETKAGFYGEHPAGIYGPYGTDTDMIDDIDDTTDAGVDEQPEVAQAVDDLFPKDTSDVFPDFVEEFNKVFTGDLTYYDKMGEIGACSQTWVPPGFETVALNAPQFENGAACGTCLRACYNDLGLGQGEICFDAIVDNNCPQCKSGDIDLFDPSGDGRWPVEWTQITCPEREGGLLGTTEGSNPYYAKMKFEGGPSSVAAVDCFDVDIQFWPAEGPTSDGFWVIDPSGMQRPAGGEFRCGVRCSVTYSCCPDVKVSTLLPDQFMSDGDGCPDDLGSITFYNYYDEYY